MVFDGMRFTNLHIVFAMALINGVFGVSNEIFFALLFLSLHLQMKFHPPTALTLMLDYWLIHYNC
jgi:hypothetical protein